MRRARVAQWVRQWDYLTTYISLSPIRRGFASSFVNYKIGCTRLAAASDKVYQLLAHGRWFSLASSTTKTGCHDIAEILPKVALNTINQIKSNQVREFWLNVLAEYSDGRKHWSHPKHNKNMCQSEVASTATCDV
jgi:hypothetical protein